MQKWYSVIEEKYKKCQKSSLIGCNIKEIAFDQYIHSFVKDEQMYYIILDEIQLVDDFEYILNGLLYEKISMYT